MSTFSSRFMTFTIMSVLRDVKLYTDRKKKKKGGDVFMWLRFLYYKAVFCLGT